MLLPAGLFFVLFVVFSAGLGVGGSQGLAHDSKRSTLS